MEALHQLIHKNAVELVQNQETMGLYNRLFLIKKTNNWWRPILDLSNLNKFLKKFKMEMDIPIQNQSRIANLISKLNFYKLIPYPMDNMLNRSAQTGPPNVRKRRPVSPPAGRSSHCTRQVACRTSFLSRQADVIASFSLSKPIRPLVK